MIRIVVSRVDTTGTHNAAVGHADHAVSIQWSMGISWGNGSRAVSIVTSKGIPLAPITRLLVAALILGESLSTSIWLRNWVKSTGWIYSFLPVLNEKYFYVPTYR